MPGFRLSPFQNFKWRLYLIEFGPTEIRETLTHGADEMVVKFAIWIEPVFFRNRDSLNEPVTFER